MGLNAKTKAREAYILQMGLRNETCLDGSVEKYVARGQIIKKHLVKWQKSQLFESR
jgi:hypothetical protein